MIFVGELCDWEMIEFVVNVVEIGYFVFVIVYIMSVVMSFDCFVYVCEVLW